MQLFSQMVMRLAVFLYNRLLLNFILGICQTILAENFQKIQPEVVIWNFSFWFEICHGFVMESIQCFLHIGHYCFIEMKIRFTPLSVNANILTVTIHSLCLKEHFRAGQVSSVWIASSSWTLHHQSQQVSAP